MTQSEEDDMREKACDIADDYCEKYLNELTADPDPLNWERIEWHDDLKWVTIRKHVAD